MPHSCIAAAVMVCNGRSEANIRIWKLLATCCCCFLPSDQFKQTLFAYLLRSATDKSAGGVKPSPQQPKKRSASLSLRWPSWMWLPNRESRHLRSLARNDAQAPSPDDAPE
jgi:hypothetical protein